MNMEGLEVIEQIAVTKIPDVAGACLMLGWFVILIITIIVYLFTKSGRTTIVTEFVSGLVYAVLISALLVSGVLEKPTGEYQYKVRITEDIGYAEFTDKYEVIAENDDETYIIQEKNFIKE